MKFNSIPVGCPGAGIWILLIFRNLARYCCEFQLLVGMIANLDSEPVVRVHPLFLPQNYTPTDARMVPMDAEELNVLEVFYSPAPVLGVGPFYGPLHPKLVRMVSKTKHIQMYAC